MKKILQSLIIIIFISCLTTLKSASGQQQHLYYKLFYGNDTVGELTVVDTKNGRHRNIDAVLKAEIPALLFHITLNDRKSVVYADEILKSALVTRSLFNGNGDTSRTLFRNNYYLNGLSPDAEIIHHGEIGFSMTVLYTTEPVNEKFIYSEFHREFVSVIKTGNHIYKIVTPDGQTGIYYYENGICVKVETKTRLAVISTILVNKSIALK